MEMCDSCFWGHSTIGQWIYCDSKTTFGELTASLKLVFIDGLFLNWDFPVELFTTKLVNLSILISDTVIYNYSIVDLTQINRNN